MRGTREGGSHRVFYYGMSIMLKTKLTSQPFLPIIYEVQQKYSSYAHLHWD